MVHDRWGPVAVGRDPEPGLVDEMVPWESFMTDIVTHLVLLLASFVEDRSTFTVLEEVPVTPPGRRDPCSCRGRSGRSRPADAPADAGDRHGE